jgi:choline dehydrogenase-like flavoprotein
MKDALKPCRFVLIKQATNNQMMAHACGTCRFGLDSRNSVLDRNNRAHGLENLYVVDSSFFPSSAGTNPGLTIAANALRVAESMLANSDRRGGDQGVH